MSCDPCLKLCKCFEILLKKYNGVSIGNKCIYCYNENRHRSHYRCGKNAYQLHKIRDSTYRIPYCKTHYDSKICTNYINELTDYVESMHDCKCEENRGHAMKKMFTIKNVLYEFLPVVLIDLVVGGKSSIRGYLTYTNCGHECECETGEDLC